MDDIFVAGVAGEPGGESGYLSWYYEGLQDVTEVVYNFDGTGRNLQPGRTYQWNVIEGVAVAYYRPNSMAISFPWTGPSDANGYSGALNGEFLFTTTLGDEGAFAARNLRKGVNAHVQTEADGVRRRARWCSALLLAGCFGGLVGVTPGPSGTPPTISQPGAFPSDDLRDQDLADHVPGEILVGVESSLSPSASRTSWTPR